MPLQGFLGTRADLLTDLVITALVAVVPFVLWNQNLARRGRWALHKRMQIGLAVLLGLVVAAFEYNLRLQGGIFEATTASAYSGTLTLNFWIWFHTFLAITTVIVWASLIIMSLRRFPSPPQPAAFSATHRRWGRIGIIWMLATGLTSLPVYFFGYAR